MSTNSMMRKVPVRGLALLPLLALVVALVAFAISRSDTSSPAPVEAAGPGPGFALQLSGAQISCDVPANPVNCMAGVNASFTLRVVPNPLPAVPISGYSTEVILGSITRSPQACASEALGKVAGNPAPVCIVAIGPGNAVQHALSSGVSAPPLPALDTPIPTLVQMNVACPPNAVTETVQLTALPDAPFGAGYFDVNTGEIYPKVQASGIADTVTIQCNAPPTGTATNTRTATPTHTPTRTPTSTPTATVSPTQTNTPTQTPLPSQLPDVTVSKSDSPDPVDSNGTLTYTILARNIGLLPATGVVVSDTLPPGTAFVSAPGCSHNAGVVLCAIGNLAANDGAPGGPDEATRTISVTAPTMVVDERISNVAQVSAQNEPFANAGNNKDIEETVVLALRSDVVVEKTDLGFDPVSSGGAITYGITVDNIGPQSAQNVVVTDTLPAGVVFSSASPACDHVAGVVTCSFGKLAPQGQVTASISVNAPLVTQDTLLKNRATVSSDNELFAQTGNNLDVENTAVIAPAPDLQLVKTESQDPVRRVAQFTYSLTITNIGGGDALGVHVTDTLPTTTTEGVPQHMLFKGATGGSCSLTLLDTIECDVPLIPANGGQVVITLNLRAVSVTVDRLLTNTASVLDPDEPDDPQGNNSDSEQTTFHACFDVQGTNLLVTANDIFLQIDRFGSVAPGPPYAPIHDFNMDGAVTALDIFLVLQHFGQTCVK